MLQYLVIILDNTSTSYCHYASAESERRLISLDDLKKGIFFAMKENLMVQYVWPNYELPQEYKQIMDSVDHHVIAPSSLFSNGLKADIVVWNDWREMLKNRIEDNVAYVLRISKKELFMHAMKIAKCFERIVRLNIIVTDVWSFKDEDYEQYSSILDCFCQAIVKIYREGEKMQLNLLTDRIFLEKMNNCNGGNEIIALAPNGKFYVCPAFYYDEMDNGNISDVGNLMDGLNVKYPYLYKLSHAPICRNCDAYQCKRCVWLNRKLTNEVNIPGHEQCVMAHIERNASRKLLNQLRAEGQFMPAVVIEEKEYLDPFERIILNRQ